MRAVVVRIMGRVSKEKNCKRKKRIIPPEKTKLCCQFLKISVVVDSKTAKKRENPIVMIRLFFGGMK